MLLLLLWLCTIFPGGLVVAGAAMAHAPGAGLVANLWGIVVFGCPIWWAWKYARRALRDPRCD